MNLLAIALVLFVSTYDSTQIGSTKPKPQPQSLSLKREWPIFTVGGLLKGDDHEGVFYVATSWIPGTDRKGSLRYQVVIATLAPRVAANNNTKENPLEISEDSKFLDKLHDCKLNLALQDGDGFILRREQIYTQRTVDEHGNTVALKANDATPMSEAEYRSLVNKPTSESVSILWNCGE